MTIKEFGSKSLSCALTKEFYRFKKQQFVFEDLRMRPLKSIGNLYLLLTAAVVYTSFINEKRDERLVVMRLVEQSKRIYERNKLAFMMLPMTYLSYFQNASRV